MRAGAVSPPAGDVRGVVEVEAPLDVVVLVVVDDAGLGDSDLDGSALDGAGFDSGVAAAFLGGAPLGSPAFET